MKKTIIGLLLFLVACSSADKGTVICKIEYEEDFKINRSIALTYTGNAINQVESIDEIFFDDNFTKEMYAELKEDLEEKYASSKLLTYSIEELDESIVITSRVLDYFKATISELSFVGIELGDAEYGPGLKETKLINENNGYSCEVVE